MRGTLGIVAFLAIYEAFARSGMFSTAITPPLETIAAAFVSSLAGGYIFLQAGATLLRVAIGMAFALIIAVPLGMLMGRHRLAERALAPLVSILMPIPSLAWVPLIVLWFGIGNTATILVVVYAAAFPLLFNVWTGVRTVNQVWVRAAVVMGASRACVFRQVILPAALPYVITGVRLAFGRAWIAVIGGELLASPETGLGKVIFDANEYLNADVMLSALMVIGVIGLFFERMVFNRLERVTVERWGMTAKSGR
ncbi:MAG: ABC transporter permease [Betaproteobacteria bacterium]|nr:ABC transporter permease [Betaproteobacteria bacterium]